MRKLLWLIALGAGIWSGYWFLGTQGVERGLAVWLEDRRGEGWQAEVQTVSTQGFPRDVETVLRELDLVDPDTGLGWSAPEFRFRTPLHAPTTVEAVWPQTQRIVTPDEALSVTSEVMRADLGLVPGRYLELDTSRFEVINLGVASTKGWTSSLETATLNVDRMEEADHTYEMNLVTRNLKPARVFLLDLDPTGRLPETFDELKLNATVRFDAPWDRRAIEDRRPQPVEIDLSGMNARWGEMELEAAGLLTVTPDGFPEGNVTLRAVNWREMLEIAKASGAIPTELEGTAVRAMETLARMSGNPRTIDAPLTFARGRVSLGGVVPLGSAPNLRLR